MTHRPRPLIATLLVAVVATALGAPLALDRYGAWHRAQQHAAGMEVLRRTMAAMDQTAFRARGEVNNFAIGDTIEFVCERSGAAIRMDYRLGAQSLGGIVTDGQHVWRTRPDGWTGDPAEPLTDWTRMDLPVLERDFWVLLTGRRRVGGRPSYEVTMVPRGVDRRSSQFFVDTERYVILGAAQFDLSSGRPIAETHFTMVAFDPGDLAQVTMPAPEAPTRPVLTSATFARALNGSALIAPEVLPGGFVLRGAMVSECADHCGIHLVHLRYSDGQHTLSVFERVDAPHQCVDPGICCAHAPLDRVVEGGRVRFLTVRRGGLEFTLVGSLPEPALREIGGTLH